MDSNRIDYPSILDLKIECAEDLNTLLEGMAQTIKDLYIANRYLNGQIAELTHRINQLEFDKYSAPSLVPPTPTWVNNTLSPKSLGD